METPVQDIERLKEKLRTTWNAGDYGIIARGLRDSAEQFLARSFIEPGEKLLDVGCGSGQIAIPAARAGAKVTGIDIAENWIAQAISRADAEGVNVRFDVGDVEDMPYPDAAFDVVISLIGAMFAPRPERATEEMLRVCRPGGRIIMGNWTPEGFIGKFFRTIADHAPPPDMPSPLLWGDETVVRRRLDHGVSDLQLERRMAHFDYSMPPAELVEHFLTYFGPAKQAVAKLDEAGEAALRRDLEALWSKHNEAVDGTTQVDAEMLEVVAVRK